MGMIIVKIFIYSIRVYHSMMRSENRGPKLLLMGYNGTNNTGSEARLVSIIEDVRAVMGPSCEITIPSLNPEYLRRYITEGPNLHIKKMPSIYYFFLRRLVKKHDMTILVEGSCYMDTWASPLLWAFLCTSKFSHRFGKPSLAYAVDSGGLSEKNKRKVVHIASKTDLIITRTPACASHLKTLGITAPIEVTADCAFTYRSHAADEDLLFRVWEDSKRGVVGFAPLNFHLWPVVLRLFDKKKYCYRWPYYFSHSNDRDTAEEKLVAGWAKQAERVIKKHHKSVALICMEQLDEPIAQKILTRISSPEQVRIFSSRDYNASQMTSILRSCDLIVTSRYHASVLTLSARIPQIALGHDTRLKRLYQDLGLYEDYYIQEGLSDAWKVVSEKADSLLADPKLQKEKIGQGYESQLRLAQKNQELLKDFVAGHGF
jgi:polysaccharide pyruvyl transferase WcaK-like protein